MIRRLALRSSDFVVPSQVLMRIAQRSWKTSATRLHYIPNGISIAGFANRSADKIASETPVIGTVAALRPEKNLTRLLEAFASVNRQLKCELRIVGDGPQRSQLEWLAAKLEIAPSVSFCGFIADPRPQYAAFDLFALSSDTEQMPYTVLEAMASGLPVVATDVGDVKTMVSDDNASLICSRSAEALAESMLRVLKDRQFAKGVGTSNRIKVRREYDIERMYAAFAQLYGIQDGPSETVSPRV
jgi:glycosyltransferase involved in cell wall biosynthesis